MQSICRTTLRAVVSLACLVCHLGILVPAASADQRVVLRSGMTLEGLLVPRASLDENAFQAGGQAANGVRPILLVDDGLRRIYVHKRGMVAGPPQDVRGVEKMIDFEPKGPLGGDAVQGIGDILHVSEFNQYGRRSIALRGPKGDVIEIIQGITELNSRYAKVEALKSRPAYTWDMRVATSSIPPATLQRIFRYRIDQDDIDQRLMVVRFFIESKRFRAAEEELTRAIREFPELKNMEGSLVSIVSQQANQLIDEAIRRAEVGQEQYARNVYEHFPMHAVGRLIREKVKIELEALNEMDQEVRETIESLQKDVAQLTDGQQNSLKSILSEIESGLSSATIARLSDYSRLKNSDTIGVEERVALAVAGWLMGPGSGEQNLIVASSLVQVRDLVAKYLGSANIARRAEILEQLRTIEGAQIQYVAKLLPQLTPVKLWPEGSKDERIPGFYRVGALATSDSSPGLIEDPDYLIQLPPEYDPLRSYPCLVALAPPNAPPVTELTWWAGDFSEAENTRIGHATRNGFIVISPKWGRDTQRTYEYTPREHRAVLTALRHAMRRASIDSDRVFLCGHGEGATAAWDIALSHPDHWAGMISINGEPSKTIQHYYPNARHVPLYFVMGESSGPKPPLVRMGTVLNRYMDVHNDATVVMYRGRGRENFYEEIPELFQWLTVPTRIRKPIPQKIETVTMRAGDQYFWWLELGPLKPMIETNPVLWDQDQSPVAGKPKRLVAGKIDAFIGGGNQVRIDGPADSFTLLMRPDMGLDLNEQVIVRGMGVPIRFQFDGKLETILEDTRQRADRKRPFWAKLQIP